VPRIVVLCPRDTNDSLDWTRAEQADVLRNIRDFVIYSGYQARISWDVTGDVRPGDVRIRKIGYYYAREYGNLYLENRKSRWPDFVTYIPYLVLRDAWHLSKYMNLNQVQLTVQNIEQVPDHNSNAHHYTNPYAFAITMMGIPLFFQDTQLYSEGSREALKPLIMIHREHRLALNKGFALPFGSVPDDGSWPGQKPTCGTAAKLRRTSHIWWTMPIATYFAT
jgi:hypothetical protein